MRLRWVLIALIAFVAIGGVFSLASNPAPASKSSGLSDCSAKQRVDLVIDFGDGRVRTGCAANFTGTGWQLFKALGIEVQGTDQYPEGFVCRIDNSPTLQEQGCHSTPRYDQGSWAYFYATAETGGKWVFSPTGAALRHPPCGSVEGWRFIHPGEEPATSPPSTNLRPHQC